MVSERDQKPFMVERKSDPPSSDRSKKGRGAGRLKPEQYEIKIRWEKARKVLEVSPTGVRFDFDSALKVGIKYPISLSAPGVSFSSTLEVTRCQMTLEPSGNRFFRIDGRFFPYVE